MMDTNKYYTPSIEEFHVGLELEIKTHELRPWEKHTWIPGDQAKSVSNYLDQIRVKYLDSEDIESLGFNETYDDTEGNVWFKSNKSDKIRLCFIDGLNFNIEICDSSNHCNNDTIFKGLVKNKSELKRILKMIGVIE